MVQRTAAASPRRKQAPSQYQITAVDKALEVLEAFQGKEEMTLEEICRATDLPKSTTFRILSTLEAREYVVRGSEERRYRLGMKLFVLGQTLLEQSSVRRLARPHMSRLSERYGETVNLGVLSGPDVLYVDTIDSHRPFRVTEAPGSRSPVYVTALGKAIAAHLPAAEQERIVSQQSFKPLTHSTITDPAQFMAELSQVALQGFAVDNEEGEVGVRCVAAPIRGSTGYAVASISLSAPAVRLSDHDLVGVAAEVGSACLEVSRNLGFRS